MLFIYILPSLRSCTRCLRTKFHHFFQITLVFFTTKCKQVTNTLLPSGTFYPHFLLCVWGSITLYMFLLLKRGFLIWLSSGTDSEMQVTQSIYHFHVIVKIAFQIRSYQMSVYGCLGWVRPPTVHNCEIYKWFLRLYRLNVFTIELVKGYPHKT